MLAGLVVDSLVATGITIVVTAFFIWIVLKFLDSRSFPRVLGTVLLEKIIVAIALPFVLSFFFSQLAGFWFLIIEIIVGFLVYKYGLDLSVGRTIILIIVTPILTILLGVVFALLGVAALVGLATLL